MSFRLPIKYRILLLGDDCVDVYQYGNVERLSPEAPVPVLKINRVEQKPGMAGNVKRNLENLGCAVYYVHGKTSTKTRLIDEKSMQHIVRVDNDVISDPIDFSSLTLAEFDAIVISDYEKGSISYDTIKKLRQQYSGPIFVDTKKVNLAEFNGCIVKINQKEYNDASSLCSDLIITCGEKGAKYKDIMFSGKEVKVADVCGAGDTFLSALTYKYLIAKDMKKSIEFAIAASTVTVQHVGVYAPRLEEI